MTPVEDAGEGPPISETVTFFHADFHFFNKKSDRTLLAVESYEL